MSHSNNIEIYLEQQDVSYEVILHQQAATLEGAAKAAGVDLHQVVRGVILNDYAGKMMLVLPADHLIDFSALKTRFGRVLELASIDEVVDLFPDCNEEIVPPLAVHYGLQAAIDNKIQEMDEVYFQAGELDYLLRISGDDFRKLYTKEQWGEFSQPSSMLAKSSDEFLMPETAGQGHAINDLLPSDDIKKRIEKVRQTPVMPEMATQILQLRNNPKSNADDLAKIVALDPSLSAQVVRYARSAFFNYHGEITTIKTAIVRVLGFNMVMNMAMGLALGKGFRIPVDGPLGLKAFWRHAIFSAALAQALCALIPKQMRPKPDLAYLAGLLHNFGYLLMGHVLKSEFFLLNKTVAANPDVPVTLLEKRLLGVNHTQVGAWLMKSWDMPEEVIVTMEEHHNDCYQGEHANYVNLMLIVDCLLKERGLGDAIYLDAKGRAMTALGLEPDKVDALVKHILKDKAELDAMARQLIK
jgi:putative nucleotidyltransferase with HDIG domain